MSEGGSKYASLFRTSREEEPEEEQVRPLRRRNRRKTGKRSNPAYRQVTAYIRTDTYELVHYALVGKKNERGKRLEFSELVDSLLREWAAEEGWTPEELEQFRT
ncbi:hypothetical protein [Rubrobacter calidifluminis]|uniref:hypothetical protein n=1 Tax=Rubrobacter calidifluminis TaxID=1392640 RepID=UPI002360FBA2|nr:hypothetical protein [Rubrobacter calidifluminis]